MSAESKRKYGEMGTEELERKLRETFFYTDRIDETVYLELERLRKALEEREPEAISDSAEEFWERFTGNHGEELDRICAASARTRTAAKAGRRRAILRSVLIAAAVFALLAGAALAAGPRLRAWTPGWNAAAGRYEPVVREAADRGTVLAALTELGITEPVYPTRLPEGFSITESHISREPLVLMEQYARGDQRLSITITPLKGFDAAVYQPEGETAREYRTGRTVHYMFRSEGTITAIWCTEHYAASLSGNLSLNEIKSIIDSVYALPKGGPRS